VFLYEADQGLTLFKFIKGHNFIGDANGKTKKKTKKVKGRLEKDVKI
jgi:hypothetical protein